MASIFEKEPIFLLETWDDKTNMLKKTSFWGTWKKAEVHIKSGLLGMKFFYKKTLLDFYMQEMNSSGAGARLSQNLIMFSLAVTKLPGVK
jgi:hypothetical protein